METPEMSENNIPHVVDQGSSIMPHEGMKPGSIMNVDPGHVFISNQPKSVGCWVIGDSLRVYVQRKVSDEQIKATEETFGWQWEDGDMNSHFNQPELHFKA